MTKRMVKKRKRVLNDMHRTYIVQQVACFMGPTETAAAVNKEFGLNVSRQAMEYFERHERLFVEGRDKSLLCYRGETLNTDVGFRGARV